MKLLEHDSEVYRLICVPFVPKDAQSTFQPAMHVIPLTVEWRVALSYLEGIVTFSESISNHPLHLPSALILLSDAGVWLERKKCFDFYDKIAYFDRLIKLVKCYISDKATDAIGRPKHPTNVKELKSFLSVCNAFGWFDPNFVGIAAPPNLKEINDNPFYLMVSAM